MENEKLFAMPFSKVYGCLTAKAERKGRTAQEVAAILRQMSGWEEFPMDATLGEFWRNAPAPDPRCERIRGSVCGIRVENIEDPLLRRIRQADKLVDELAKGKPLEKVLSVFQQEV